MFRNICSVLFVFFILPGMLVAQTINYVLRGKVSNWSPPARAYLVYEKNGVIQSDSTFINSGMFTFHGVSMHSDDAPYLVVSKSGNRMASMGVKLLRFFTDSSVISIVISDSLNNVAVTAGPLNRDAATLNAALAPVEVNIQAAGKAYEAATDSQKNSGSFREGFEERSAALEREKQAVYLHFIRSHPNSMISLDALKSLGGQMPDVEVVEPAFNSLSANIRSTKKGIEYAAKMAGLKKIMLGRTAPDFTLHDTSGKPVSLHDFKGKYLFLDFWASWCPSCRAESTYIAGAFNAYQHRNFTVLGISLDNPDKKKEWLAAIHEDHLTWTQVASLTMWNNSAATLYSVSSIPQNFLIAPDGKIIAKNLRGRALRAKLQEILGE